MTYLEPCLVLNLATNQWRVEERPPVAPAVEPWNEWSSDVWSFKLKKACEGYRKRGEKLTGATRLSLRRRAKSKFMEAAE